MFSLQNSRQKGLSFYESLLRKSGLGAMTCLDQANKCQHWVKVMTKAAHMLPGSEEIYRGRGKDDIPQGSLSLGTARLLLSHRQ
jgi:hypothetical protein